MRVIPVIDLKGGHAVRAVAGQRDNYHPLETPLARSSHAADIARGLLKSIAANELYVADINALQGRSPDQKSLREVLETGAEIWLDRGVRNLQDVVFLQEELADAVEKVSIILGSETVLGEQALASILASLDANRAIFSLDLKSQAPLSAQAWNNQPLEKMIDAAVQLGIRHFIVLDLARVGVSSGTGTVDLCLRLRERYADIELFAGGGVRGLSDLQELHAAGCDGALVATALHDGRLSLADVRIASSWK